MTTRFIFVLAIFIGTFGTPISDARAATCDATKSKFVWRRCMSKEIDKLTSAIGSKALDLCGSKTNSASGPAAVDERLSCRMDILTKTLKSMN